MQIDHYYNRRVCKLKGTATLLDFNSGDVIFISCAFYNYILYLTSYVLSSKQNSSPSIIMILERYSSWLSPSLLPIVFSDIIRFTSAGEHPVAPSWSTGRPWLVVDVALYSVLLPLPCPFEAPDIYKRKRKQSESVLCMKSLYQQQLRRAKWQKKNVWFHSDGGLG